MEQDKYILKHNYSVKDSRELLEWLITEKLNEWQIYNVDPSTENYLNDIKMKECIMYIIKGIMLELTPVQLDILSVGYPMETEEDQINTIKNKAKLVVLNYSINQNVPKDGLENIPNINAF